MEKDINCGRFWTIASVECYLQECNNKCRYFEICKRASGFLVPFIMKRVIKMLEKKVGPPPQSLLDQAMSEDLYL